MPPKSTCTYLMPQQFRIYTSKKQTLKQKRTHRHMPGFVVHATSQRAESTAELQKRACLRGKFTIALFLLAKGWGKPKCLANK